MQAAEIAPGGLVQLRQEAAHQPVGLQRRALAVLPVGKIAVGLAGEGQRPRLPRRVQRAEAEFERIVGADQTNALAKTIRIGALGEIALETELVVHHADAVGLDARGGEAGRDRRAGIGDHDNRAPRKRAGHALDHRHVVGEERVLAALPRAPGGARAERQHQRAPPIGRRGRGDHDLDGERRKVRQMHPQQLRARLVPAPDPEAAAVAPQRRHRHQRPRHTAGAEHVDRRR